MMQENSYSYHPGFIERPVVITSFKETAMIEAYSSLLSLRASRPGFPRMFKVSTQSGFFEGQHDPSMENWIFGSHIWEKQ